MAASAGARRQNIEPAEKEAGNEEAYCVLKELLRLSKKERTTPYDHVLDTVCQLTEPTVNAADKTILFHLRETLREELLFYVTIGRHKDIHAVFDNIRNYAQSEDHDVELPPELKPDKPDEWRALPNELSLLEEEEKPAAAEVISELASAERGWLHAANLRNIDRLEEPDFLNTPCCSEAIAVLERAIRVLRDCQQDQVAAAEAALAQLHRLCT